MRIRTPILLRVTVAALAFALAVPAAFAAGRGGGPPAGTPGSGNPGSGSGKPGNGAQAQLLPVLSNGTPVEPSTWREESTESTEILDEGRWSWEVTLVGGSWDRADSLASSTLEWAHAEVRRGLGRGLQVRASFESWDRADVREGALASSVRESGYDPVAIDLRRRLTREGTTGPSACAGSWIRLPGSPDGPNAHVTEGGVFLPVTFPLGSSTHFGTMVEANIVPDALDSGRHWEGVSSVELSQQFVDRLSGRIEAVGVWYGEPGRPMLGVVNAGLTLDPVPHVGITLGAAGGRSGATMELGGYGRLSVHP
jgi:hypothetical protein